MKGHPTSYKDPAYDGYDQMAEAKYDLPPGLLTAIRTKGEKTDADQVSSAGGRTSYQIIPATRKAIIAQAGFDPWLSPENAAEGAAYLLKQNLDRNNGDVKEAVAEYHAGTNRAARGPINRAYVARVTGGAAPADSAPGQSTYDRVKAKTAQDDTPSIAKVYEAYKAGKLDPQAKAEFEKDVNEGAIMLPRGAKIDVPPTAHVLPKGVVAAYNSHSEMTDAERSQLDDDLASSLIALPKGVTLSRPAARTAGEMVGMGARNVAEGAGGLVDIVAGPANALVNTVAGTNLSTSPTRDLASAGADALGLATPGTNQEKLAGSLIEGGTQGLLTAGVGGAVAGLEGAPGLVGRELAANPITDTIASAAATGGQEVARQNDVGPVGQLAAALVGGVTGVGMAKGIEAAAAKFGPKAAKIVETVPREVMLDEKGALTDEGREVAHRAELSPEQIKGAYDEAETVAAQPAPQEAAPAPAGVVDEAAPPVAAEAAPEAPVAPVEAVAAPVETAAPVADLPPPADAQARFDEAKSEGVILSKAQAEKDFGAQEREQTLSATDSPEGRDVRQHFEKQGQQITAAVDRFKSAFGDTSLGATERGQIVKDAVRDLRDSGRAGVKALFDHAKELATSLGEDASNVMRLDTAPLLGKLRELFIDEAVPEATRKSLKQQAAKYGLIGENPKTVEGETTVQLRDSTGELGGRVTFTGPPKTLDLTNFEDFRQAINALYDPGKANQQEGLKGILDDAVEAAVERASAHVGELGQAFKAGRQAHRVQMQTFKAKDVVEKIIGWKKGTQTDELKAEDVIKTVLQGGPEGVTNLRKLKAVLLSNPTEKSRNAWRAVQAHGVADIFKQALSPNDTVSGLRLNSAIKKFGPEKLKLLLAPEDFNQLMKLRRIIGDATIPLPKTTNPSGSGYAVIRFLSNAAQQLAPVGRMVPMVRDVVKGAEEFGAARTTKATAEGVTDFKPANTNAAPKPKVDPAAWARKFINLASSDEIITPIIAAAANEERP